MLSLGQYCATFRKKNVSNIKRHNNSASNENCYTVRNRKQLEYISYPLIHISNFKKLEF